MSKDDPAPRALDAHWYDRFGGIDRLYGRGTLDRLAASRVAIIGLGGVGSWVAEALARSGVGHLALVDADEICVSNTNRQLPALEGRYGWTKVEAMAERCRAINPAIGVDEHPCFLTSGNMESLLAPGFDLVLDACDSFRSKVELVAWCRRRKQPVIVCGSAGGRTDPTQVRVRDLSRTEHDAMLALIRKKLRADFNFPRNASRYFGVPAVYSLENVQYPQADGRVCGVRPKMDGDAGFKLDCGAGLGAATHVTGAFAFAMVAKAIPMLLKDKDPTGRADADPVQADAVSAREA
ncbi:tRNA threonylcarbamoyladenosine dehydratase [Lysobacter sp. A3-1-A15]|uniref:tRNA threonylcarbamoyladenosine dehydratase n=1 Tax=Novilysobacter viscosus TaxID=3098602 RepID=UPI002ED8317C